MSEDCLFCQIIEGEVDTDLVYEDDKIVVFEDIDPQAPVHLLLVPKKHIATLLDLQKEDLALVSHIYFCYRFFNLLIVSIGVV